MGIRRSVPGDEEALGALYLELQQHHFELQPHNPRYGVASARWHEIAAGVLEDAHHEVLIAEEDGGVIGCAVLRYEEKPWGLACQIETLVVRGPWRGRGIGGALIAASEEAAVQRGAGAMRVEVIVENDPGRAFYERRGYDPLALRYGKPLPKTGP